MRRRFQRGQVTVEAAILFTFVIAALVGMAIYLQRGAQGGVKSNSDSLGTQFSAKSAWNSTSKSKTHEDKVAVTSDQTSEYDQNL